MAKKTPSKQLNEGGEEQKTLTPNEILNSELQANKDSHYNFTETIPLPKISSGSLNVDLELGGGYSSGLHRFVGFTEGGKEQPVSAKVLGRKGWVNIGDLKIGDKIFDSNGELQEVLYIIPQGVKDVYKVTFSDGTTAECGLEHLWETSSWVERNFRAPRKSVKDTEYLIKTLSFWGRPNHSVRLNKPIIYPEEKHVIDPYLMGVLLGDGGITQSVSITNSNPEIWNFIDKILISDFPNLVIKQRNEYTKSLVTNDRSNPIRIELKKLGLLGKLKENKFIPEQYLRGSISQRYNLLQGLIDADGYLDKNDRSKFHYHSYSETLIHQVAELIRSLGGLAIVKDSQGEDIRVNGKSISCSKCWSLEFYVPAGLGFIPTRIMENIDKFVPRWKELKKYIKDIELVREEECVCIKVSSKDSLYITNGYNLTHNSSASLEMMRNFFLTVPNGRGLYVKAEGRLSPEIQKRSGIKFVFDTDQWKDGTCFVLETNTYDLVVNIMRQLVFAEDKKTRYFFLLDSMDGLILKSDLEKEITDKDKVAGAPALTKKFLQRCSSAMNKFGHICIMIGQVAAKIEIDPYAQKEVRQITATGGNAALHFANWIIQFEHRNQSDLILERPNERPDPIKNKIIGHWCKIILKKTPNEKSNVMIKYPICYGRTGGTSVWRELEIIDIMLIYGLMVKKGAWINISEELVKEAAQNKIELKEQYNGVTAFRVYLEENTDLTEWLFNKLKATISS